MKLLTQLILTFTLFNFQDYQEKIVVLTDGKDTIAYAKEELDKITAMFPEIKPEPYPLHPDVAYDSRGADYQSSAADAEIEMGFNSEAGQDKFYIIYAYFLKQKNGVETYRQQRQKLISIYRLINHLNRQLTYGGTYYSHLHYRIHGYAEYAIYQSSQPTSYRRRNDDITPEKTALMNSLKELVEEEIGYDEQLDAAGKQKKMREMLTIISDLEALITTRFFLKSASQFQDSYY